MAVHHHLYHSSPQLPSAYTNQWSELSLESPTEAINRRVLPPYTPADRGITDSTLTLSSVPPTSQPHSAALSATSSLLPPPPSASPSKLAALSGPRHKDAGPAVYTVFTARQKIWMTTLVSLAGATSSLSSTIYLPAIELIEDDFDTTSVMMKLSVSLYFAGGAIGPLVWGPLSDVGGRKWAYILSYGIYTLACIGLALAPNVQILLLFRFFQALGASSATPVGTGTICDLYAKDQRGVALGLFLLGSLLGPMIGPLVGGLTADTIGWRWSFWILAIYGGFLWLLIAFTVPETHRTLVAEASGAHMTQLRPLPYTLANTSLFSPARWRFNPLRPLFFLKYPFVVTTVFNISIIYSSLFCVSASMPHNFAALYDMAPSTIGLTFISVGVGSIFGSLIGGRLADLLMHRAHARYFATTTGNFALKEDGKGAAGSPHSAQFDSLPTRHSTDPHGDNMSDIQSPTLTEPHKFHIHSHSHNHRHGHGHGHSHSHSHSSHAQPEKKDLEEEEENASTISTLPDLLLNPQFRLRSGLFFSWLMPTTILLYGLFLHFGFPLASLMVVEFFFGYSMTHMYASYCNFLTDVFLTDSATVTSLYNCMRSLVSTLAVVLEEIVEETWGVHGAFALLAGVHVIGAALMFFTYYRTPKWMERWGIS